MTVTTSDEQPAEVRRDMPFDVVDEQGRAVGGYYIASWREAKTSPIGFVIRKGCYQIEYGSTLDGLGCGPLHRGAGFSSIEEATGTGDQKLEAMRRRAEKHYGKPAAPSVQQPEQQAQACDMRVQPGPEALLVLTGGFVRRHLRSSNRQISAGGAAVVTQLNAGRLWSDALIAGERAVAATPASRGFGPLMRRVARGTRPLHAVDTWWLIRLAEMRHEAAVHARGEHPEQTAVDAPAREHAEPTGVEPMGEAA